MKSHVMPLLAEIGLSLGVNFITDELPVYCSIPLQQGMKDIFIL
jgi:hypothetical protein